MIFSEEYSKIKDEIITLRRQIHRYPELGFEEFKTAESICSLLDKYNIRYTKGISETGICATIGNNTSEVLLIRADMDALPTDERTNLDFSSEHPGIMHACGHDIHVASAMAAAIILKKHETRLQCSVKFVFQPAEETTGGAEPMINEGVLKNPDVTCAVGGHITPLLKPGEFQVKTGPLMASPDDFSIRFIGKSTHGAEPQNGISPIEPACEFVNSISALKEELCNNTPNVLSVCTVSSNGGINTIPDEALILGTFRSFDDNSRNKCSEMLEELANQISKKHNTSVEFKYNFLYPPVVNNNEMTEKFINIASELYGENSVTIMEKPFMTGDDFAYFGKYVPSVYFWYGGGIENLPCTLHSSEFVVSEDAIEVCANIFTSFAMKIAEL